MTTRRVVLQHAVNLVVTPRLPASKPETPAWQQTWEDLHIEIARQVQPLGQPPITREEAWYLLRVQPANWPQWLDLFRAEGCREIAIFAATASRERLLLALQALEAEIRNREENNGTQAHQTT